MPNSIKALELSQPGRMTQFRTLTLHILFISVIYVVLYHFALLLFNINPNRLLTQDKVTM